MISISIIKDGQKLTPDVQPQNIRFSTGENGFASLSASYPVPVESAMQLYLYGQNATIIAAAHDGTTVWVGRVEDVMVNNTGITIGAFGFARAYGDLLYTALWSKDSSVGFRPTTANELSSRNGRYNLDNNNRVYLELKKDETYVNGANGAMVYELPDKGVRSAATISFSWNFENTTGQEFVMAVGGYTSAWAFVSIDFVFSSTATSGSGTQATTFPANVQKVVISFFPLSGTPYTYTGETGDTWARATNIRIKSTTSTAVTVGEIAAGLVSYIAAENPSNVTASLSGIDAAAYVDDLREQIYEDMRPSEILTDLCQVANLRWRVWQDKILTVAPVGTNAITYYVDATGIQFQSSLDPVANTAYATYSDSNRTLRTAKTQDAEIKARWGFTRETTTNVQTESQTEAERWRDALLIDQKGKGLRARVQFDYIFSANGVLTDKWRIRAGDRIVIRNLSPEVYDAVPFASSFIVERTDYNADTNVLSVEPFIPVPTLVTIIAQQGKTK